MVYQFPFTSLYSINLLIVVKENLGKSREIIRKVKEDKKNAILEMEERIKHAEKTIEEEKENLVQELSRAKAAAVLCLKVCV